MTFKQIGDIEKMFVNHGKLTCYVGPVRQTVEQFANNLLNAIDNYCRERQVQLGDLFDLNEERFLSNTIISALQLREGLRKAKIPFPAAQLNNIIKYLVRLNRQISPLFSSLSFRFAKKMRIMTMVRFHSGSLNTFFHIYIDEFFAFRLLKLG